MTEQFERAAMDAEGSVPAEPRSGKSGPTSGGAAGGVGDADTRPGVVPGEASAEPAGKAPSGPAASGGPSDAAPAGRISAAEVMIMVLLALLGFTLVVQVKTTSTDARLSTMRQEDLVRILSDFEAQEERLQQDIAVLEESQRQLQSGAEGREAALEEATRRADELGILAGRLPARGPGMLVRFTPVGKPLRASMILDAVQELRGAGAEAMQISGGDGATVRIIAGTYFLDAEGGILVDGSRLPGPYTITVIGDPKTMRTALNIPGGVVASVNGGGGNVIVQERDAVDVTALSAPTDLRYARPVS